MKTTLFVVFLVAALALPAHAQGPSYPYTVTLTCTPPTGGTPSGYNFYRASFTAACGAFSKLTSAPVSTCAYTDQNPPDGTYCYEATDLDANNRESGPDLMPGQVSIPLPPPTGLSATLAKDGTHEDVIYAWTNPAGTILADTLYCGPTAPTARVVKIDPYASSVRIYSVPKGISECAVTASGKTGESGLSKPVKVSVP